MAADELSAASASAIEPVARDVRAFLEPHWQAWHVEWGPPAPVTASQWTCGRSSAFLCFALNNAGIPAQVQSGRPSTDRGGFGFHAADQWQDHAWVVAGEWIVDITNDQFGALGAVITPISDARYRSGLDAGTQLALSSKGAQAVERLTELWIRAA